MNYLKGKRCYLSGPIEFDDGPNWRPEVIRILINEFNIEVFDPFSDTKQNLVEQLNKAKKNKDYATIRNISKQFVRKDLCLVDRSDFIISYLPYKIPTAGTVHEIINSNNCKKPTLLVTNMGDIVYIPIWYYGFIAHEFMFSGWPALFSYLSDVNAGLHKSNNRWSFIYGL